MPAENLPILYVKPGCPWCHEAEEFLSRKGIDYRQRDVLSDPAALAEMRRLSGQTRAPTLDWHGKVLADFGVEELTEFLRKENVQLEDS